MKSVEFENEQVCPSKIVCVGRNYIDHITELKNTMPDQPVIFIKPNSSVSSLLHCGQGGLHYEGELSFLIRENKLFGVGFGMDLTKRDVQKGLKEKGLPWERAKAFDGSAVLSQFVTLEGDISELSLRLSINGEAKQIGGVEDMLYSPQVLLREAQSFLTFEENDILMTGTPAGVGLVNRWDVFLWQVFLGDKLLVEQEWVVS